MKPSFRNLFMKKTHAGSRRADHLRKRLLADFCDYRLRFDFLAKVRQQRQQTGKTFLARIEQLIHEVRFDADGPAQKMGNEHLGERWLLMDHAENSRFFQSTMTESVIAATVAIRLACPARLPSKSAQRFVFVDAAVYNTFNVQRHLISRPTF